MGISILNMFTMNMRCVALTIHLYSGISVGYFRNTEFSIWGNAYSSFPLYVVALFRTHNQSRIEHNLRDDLTRTFIINLQSQWCSERWRRFHGLSHWVHRRASDIDLDENETFNRTSTLPSSGCGEHNALLRATHPRTPESPPGKWK